MPNQQGSIRFKGGGSLSTLSNSLLLNQEKASLYFVVRPNQIGSNINYYLNIPNNNTLEMLSTTFYHAFNGSPGNFIYYNFNFIQNQPSVWCLSVDATGVTSMYVNGFSVVTYNNFGVNPNGPGVLSFVNGSSWDYNISSFIYWTGYALSVQDIQNPALATNPFSINSGVACFLSMDGPIGNSVNVGDSGITNYGYGGSIYSIHSLTGSGNIVYDSGIHYIPPLIVDSYVTTSSGFLAFLLQNNGQYYYNPTVNLNPTVEVNTGGSIQTVQLTGGITDVNAPWIMYPWETPSTTGSTITYTAPYGWVNGFLSQTGYATNLYNQLPFPFETPSTRWGFNIISACVYYGNSFFFRNIASTLFNFSPKVDSYKDYNPIGGVAGTNYSIGLQQGIPNLITSSVGGVFVTGVWQYSYTDDPVYSSILFLGSYYGTETNSISYSSVISGVRYTKGSSTFTFGPVRLDPYMNVNVIPQTNSGILIKNLFITPPGNKIDNSDTFAIDQNMLYQISTSGGKFVPVIRTMGSLQINSSNMCDISNMVNISGFTWYRGPHNVPVSYVTPYVYSVTPSAYFNTYGWVDIRRFSVVPNSYVAFHAFTPGNHGLFSHQALQMSQTVSVMTTGNGQAYDFNVINYPMAILYTSPSSFIFYLAGQFNAATGVEPMTSLGVNSGIFSFTLDLTQAGIPYEAALSIPQKIPCDLWFNIPAHMNYQTSTYLANYALQTVPSGRTIYLEYTNEHWNFIFYQYSQLGQEGYFKYGQFSDVNINTMYTLNAAAHHDIWDAVFISGGRPGTINRVFGGSYGTAVWHKGTIATANANNLKIDSIAFAPYIPAFLPVTPAFTGRSYGNMAQYHDLFRHFMWYENYNNTFWPAIKNDFAAYSGGPIDIVYYEGGTQNTIDPNAPSAILQQVDFFYHPENKRTMETFFQLGQSWGGKVGAYFNLDGKNLFPNTWFMSAYPSQIHGNGDGSDGLAINKFSMTDGLQHDTDNITTAMQAWHEYTDANINVPSFNVTPTIVSEIPSSGSIGITGVPPITINFSKAINTSTIHFNLYDSNNALVPTTISSNNFSATLTPTGVLRTNTAYTIEVSGLVDTIGIPQQGIFLSSFNNSTLSVVPTSASVIYNSGLSITATLTNATGTLTASSLHGTVPGSVTTNIPFTYTAPSSGTGFTSDIVTVNDIADGLSSQCSITLTFAPVPHLSVSPTGVTVGYGRNQSITPILVNSSYPLIASATHGIVPGSVTSNVPFTYTAPTGGFSSDIVTVNDIGDNIMALCHITLTSLTRYSFYVTNNRQPIYIQLVL